ncbi:unnamed protein product [Phytomonas sp. Hart1]|nr:unnamed protein product [Phytomonas sp. Hart1]|eukprot:CCW68828.1 unnamed protein product [Phytomonas sp. isolate Hart1]
MFNITTTRVGEQPSVAPTTRDILGTTEEVTFQSISSIRRCMSTLSSPFRETRGDTLMEPVVFQVRKQASLPNFLPEILQYHTTDSYYRYYLQHYRNMFPSSSCSGLGQQEVSYDTTERNVLDRSEVQYEKRRIINSANTSVQDLSKSFDNRRFSNPTYDYTNKEGLKDAHLSSEIYPFFEETPPECEVFDGSTSVEANSATGMTPSRRLDFSNMDLYFPDDQEAWAWQNSRGGPLLSCHSQTAPNRYFFNQSNHSTGAKLLPKSTLPNISGITHSIRTPLYLKPRGFQPTHSLTEHERTLTEGTHNY